MNRFLNLFFITLFLCFFWGCATGIKYSAKPVIPVIPDKWSSYNGSTQGNFNQGWLEDFDDRELRNIVYSSLRSNPDILIAAGRVEYAKRVLRITGAALVPEISGSIQLNRSQSVIESGGKPYKEIGNKAGLSMDLSWETDIWGRIKALKNADIQELEAAYSDYEGARLSYSGQTAKAWFSAIELKLQVQLSEETLESFRLSDELLTGRFHAGLTDATDVRLIRSEKLAAKDSLINLQQTQREAVRGLKVLMGSYPSAKMNLPDKLPTIKTSVPPGLPSELLERRPDISAARKRLKASDFRTIAAEKSLFPSISLTAGLGISSSELSNLTNANYMIWNLGSGVLMPLFQGGKLRTDIKRKSSAAKQEWLNYNKTILNAFQEAEAAIDAESFLKKREDALKELVEEAQGALDKAWDSYLAGNTGITTILDSRRSVTNAKKNLISVSAMRLINRIDLYLALGGSFENRKRIEEGIN